MKKFILSAAVFIATGFVFNMNQTAKADCVTDLINDLQNCIIDKFLVINVTTGNGVIYLSGAGVNDSHANECINAYNAHANQCPNAPELVVLSTGQSATASSSLNMTQHGRK